MPHAQTIPQDLPRYPLADAARIVDVPTATARASLTILAPASPASLSFTNLVELHVLRAVRRQCRVPTPTLRAALDAIAVDRPHPLARRSFATDGRDFLLHELGRLAHLSRSQQLGLHEQLRLHLDRVVWDDHGLAHRLHPFVSADGSVTVDPHVSFGHPVVTGTGIPIDVLAERHDAGEPIDHLAEDYALDPSRVRLGITAATRLAA